MPRIPRPFSARGEASAIVFDSQNERAIPVSRQTHMDIAGARVPYDIAESFLNDSVDAGLIFFRDLLFRSTVRTNLNRNVRCPAHFASLPLQGGNKAEVVEHGGPKQEG